MARMATLRFSARLLAVGLGLCSCAAARTSAPPSGGKHPPAPAPPAAASAPASAPSDPAAVMAQIAKLYRSTDPAAQRARSIAELADHAWTYLDASQRHVAYQLLGNAYRDSLVAGAVAQPRIEARIVAPDFPPEMALHDMLTICYELAKRGLRPTLVDQCVAQTADVADNQLVAERERLLGTELASRTNYAQARAHLESAAVAFTLDDDPEMYLALGRAQRATSSADEACDTAKRLWLRHPLLPGTTELLSACNEPPAKVTAALGAEAKRQLLADALPKPATVPATWLPCPPQSSGLASGTGVVYPV